MPTIYKAGLAYIQDNKLMVVLKEGLDYHILPGGKREEEDKDYKDCLIREIKEELCCDTVLDQIVYLGSFSAPAVGVEDTLLCLELYSAPLVGTPQPCTEIVAIEYYGLAEAHLVRNDLIRYQIMPHLNILGLLEEESMSGIESSDDKRVDQTAYERELEQDLSDVFAENDDVSKTYRTLTDEEKEQMLLIKTDAQRIINRIYDLSPVNPLPHELQVAKDKAIESSMWAIKFLTSQKKADMEAIVTEAE